MKWLLLLILLFSLTGCWDDGDFFDDGDYDVDVDADIPEAGDYDLYWDDIETFETTDYPDPAQMVILISLLQGVIWMVGVPVGLGGYDFRST